MSTKNLRRLRAHRYAGLFPLIRGKQLRELAEDIRQNGLRSPVVIFQNKVLDGRNRLAACRIAKVKPTFQTYVGSDPLGYVISLNLKRRHLSESQRAMVAARISRLKRGTNQYKKMGPKNFGTITQSEAARRFKVSDRSIQHAAVVRDYGSRALNRAVEDDRISVFSAASIARLPKNQQAKIIAKADARLVIAQAKKHRERKAAKRHQERVERLLQINGKPTLSTKQRFSILLADPAYRYEFSQAKRYAAQSMYPTMSTEELCRLSGKVKRVAADDAVLLLWVPSAKLLDGLAVMKAWGFEYRTNAVWVKPSPFLGNYFRQAHELLLVGRRGELPVPLPAARPSSVITAPRAGRHSSKPDIIHDYIEKMWPRLPKLELFARRTRPGWSAWGNEISERAAA